MALKILVELPFLTQEIVDAKKKRSKWLPAEFSKWFLGVAGHQGAVAQKFLLHNASSILK